MDDITLIRETLLDDERAETGRDAARQRLRQAIGAEAAPARRRWQWALAGTGLTAAVVAGAVAVALAHPQPAPPAPPETAREFLLAAATQAATATPTKGKYWHTRWDMHGMLVLKGPKGEQTQEVPEKVTEQWQAAAPGGQSWSSFEPVKNGVYKPKVTKADQIGYGWENEFSPAEVRALPTDPEALRQTIVAKQMEKDWDALRFDGYIFSATVGLLARAPASPAQMAAAYRMLAALPGVELDGTATDSEGRTGVQLRYHGEREEDEVIVDRETYQVLARVHTNEPFVSQIVFQTREWTDTEPPH